MSFVAVSTANPLGKRPLNFMALHQGPPSVGLLGWIGELGDITGDLATAVATGALTQDQSDTLSILGVTDAQVVSIINGTDTFQSVMYQLATGQSTASAIPPAGTTAGPGLVPPKPPASGGVQIVPYTPTPTAAPATPAPSSTPPQVPTGSTITYTVSWTPGIGNLTLSGSNVMAAMQRALSQGPYRLSVTNSVQTASYANIGSGGYTVQFTILDSVGHQNVSDVQGILDNVMRSIVGNNVTASSITGVYPPGTGGIAPAPAATSLTGWFEQNAVWVALAALAIFTLPALVRKF